MSSGDESMLLRASHAARRLSTGAGRAWKVAVLPGDGIGPEVMDEALKVLRHAGGLYGEAFEFEHALVGGAAYEAHGEHFPESTRQTCAASCAFAWAGISPAACAASPPRSRCCRPALPSSA